MSFVASDLDAKCEVCGESFACPHRHAGVIHLPGNGQNLVHLGRGGVMHVRAWMKRIYRDEVTDNPEAKAPERGGWLW